MSFNDFSKKRDLASFFIALFLSFAGYYFMYAGQDKEVPVAIYRHTLIEFNYANWDSYEQSFFAGKDLSLEDRALLKLSLLKALREKYYSEKKERVDYLNTFYQSFLNDPNEIFVVKVFAYKNLKEMNVSPLRTPASADLSSIEWAAKKSETELTTLVLSPAP